MRSGYFGLTQFQFKKGCIGHFKLFGLDPGVQWLGQTRQRVRFLVQKQRCFLYDTPTSHFSNIPLNSTPFQKTTYFVFTRVFFHCNANEEVCGASLTQQNKRFFYTPLLRFPVFNGTPLLDDWLQGRGQQKNIMNNKSVFHCCGHRALHTFICLGSTRPSKAG